jgi:hypothetical protein
MSLQPDDPLTSLSEPYLSPNIISPTKTTTTNIAPTTLLLQADICELKFKSVSLQSFRLYPVESSLLSLPE